MQREQSHLRALIAFAFALGIASSARADEELIRTADKRAKVTVGGYLETFYSWNFNEPSNFITNYRGFDNRHNIFSIDNAVVDVKGSLDRTTVHIVLQVGNTPDTYYLAEPVWKATNGAGASGPDAWKFIQEANLSYLADIGKGLRVDAGIFLSPVGPEPMAVKDNWNWSRSNLFFGLPFYHTGIRATYPVTEHTNVILQLYNGWNSVVDDNVELSPAAQLIYEIPDKITFSALYFGGVERPQNAPEGRAWRNLFDAYLLLHPSKWFDSSFHFDWGLEPNNFGMSGWAAGAMGFRLRLRPWLYFAARADAFYEAIAQNASGSAAPLFWNGSHWMTSGTATVEVRAKDNLSVRLELRHDQSQTPLFSQAKSLKTDKAITFRTRSRKRRSRWAPLRGFDHFTTKLFATNGARTWSSLTPSTAGIGSNGSA